MALDAFRDARVARFALNVRLEVVMLPAEMLPEKFALPTTSKGYCGVANPIPTLELNNAAPAFESVPVFDSVADVKTPDTLKDPLLL